MNWFENLDISISYSPLILFVSIIAVILYTVFIYRTTLPIISNTWKTILVILRALALFSILFLLFEPVINITTKNKVEPKNLLLIDNSNSIKEFSSRTEIESLNNFVKNIGSELDGELEIFTFGSEFKKFDPNRDSLEFNELGTELNSALNYIEQQENIASVVLLGDGILNQGQSAQKQLQELGTPLFTIGIGDTSKNIDLKIENIISNKFIYADRETEIEVLLKNINLSEKKASIKLFESDSLISSEEIVLSNTGINRVQFPYLSKSEGEKKLTVQCFVSEEPEVNRYNNVSSKVIKVLATKKRITLIAGSPSSDLAFILKSINQHEEFELEALIEISENKFLDDNNDLKVIDDADILALVGFPNQNTSNNFIITLLDQIRNTKIPTIVFLTNSVDYNKLNMLSEVLPFKVGNISNRYEEDQVTPKNTQNLLSASSDTRIAWENLAPINFNMTEIIPNIESDILLTSKSRNRPIIFTNSNSVNKSVVINGSNIWRWKLKAQNNDLLLFDNFILNSIKWLSTALENEYLSVSLEKTNYNLGEDITFIANLYNEIYEPVNNAPITLNTSINGITDEYLFTSIGNGLYEATISSSNSGLLNYSISIQDNIFKGGPVNGLLNIEPINIELIENKLNTNFLRSIAVSTGGIYKNINNTSNISIQLNNIYNNKIYYNNIDNELRLSSFELILLFIVLLFSIEWVIRKTLRMI